MRKERFKGFMLALFLLISLTPLLFSQPEFGDAPGEGGGDIGVGGQGQLQMCSGTIQSEMLSATLIGFAGLIALAAISYMAGSFLQHPKLLLWPKTEISQIIFSAILLALIIQIFSLFCSISLLGTTSITSASNEDIFAAGEKVEGLSWDDTAYGAAQKFLIYLESKSYSSFSQIRERMGDIETDMTLNKWSCNTVQTGFCILGGSGISHSPNSGKQAISAMLGVFLNTSAIALLTSLAQISIYKFLLAGTTYSNSFLIALLTFGLVLRSVPFMRGLGGALLAIAISLYIIFPLMLMLEAIFFPAVYSAMEDGYLLGNDDAGYDSDLIIRSVLIFIGAVFFSSLNFIAIVGGILETSALLGQPVDASRIARLI